MRAYADDLSINATTREVDYVALLSDLVARAAQIGLQVRVGKSALYAENFDVATLLNDSQLQAISALPVVDPDCRLRLIPPSEGITIVGGPIGPDDFVQQECLRLVDKTGTDMQLLRKIEGRPQEYNLLLAKCFNARVMHLARCVPPKLLEPAARAHDFNVGEVWARPIYGLPPPRPGEPPPPILARALARARLPAREGGLGLRSLLDVRHAAFPASVARAWFAFAPRDDICRTYFRRLLPESLRVLADAVPAVIHVSDRFPSEIAEANAAARHQVLAQVFDKLEPAVGQSWRQFVDADPDRLFSRIATGIGATTAAQRTFSKILSSRTQDEILRDFYKPSMSSTDLSCAARYLSGACADAVAWATSVPTQPEFVVSPEEYRWLTAKHLQLPVPGHDLIGSSCTDERHTLDGPCHHLFVCPSHRTIPHDNTRDRIRSFCASAGLKAVIEPTGCLQVQQTGMATCKRPDIAVTNLDTLGKTILLDVTTTDAGNKTNVNTYHAYRYLGVAARMSDEDKRRKYATITNPSTQSFMPMAFELGGRWGPSASLLFDLVKKRSRELRGFSPAKHGRFVGHWRRVISVGFQRDIARSAIRVNNLRHDTLHPCRVTHPDLGRM